MNSTRKAEGKFGTIVSCIDGRAIAPAHDWMIVTHKVDFVDVISEHAIAAHLGKFSKTHLKEFETKLSISTKKHGSRVIAVVGHDDCEGDRVSTQKQHVQVYQAVEQLRKSLAKLNVLDAEIIPLWVHMDVDGWSAVPF